ncbi:S-layer homology domain-containing protein [Agathobaculum desmolans]|uniref:S-layer homology domain-containing protein n=1 Tax=Agathobaculum desmolans TaxID=39484 RepID=UPI0004E26443|nr:S-layer homology domain-containing protein [Agathobaculum desmolans]
MKKNALRPKRLCSLLLTLVMLLSLLPVQALAVNEENGPSSFLAGPYLLTPKTDGIVVAWELDQPMKSTLSYGLSADAMQETEVRVEEGEAFQGKPMYLYRARLTGLAENTKYVYKVTAENGQTVEGSFRTLPADPQELRFAVVSDSHRFETASQVSDAIRTFDPHFILHTGDMVEGTGSQKDQFAYWFRNAGDFLHHVPVIYNSGNHDYGVYFDEYVSKIQKEQYHANESGSNISFNVGGVHITMMDSNPWALFELNSASGGQVDAATRKLVDDSLAWLKADLASSEAKNADFRVLTMHHPYEDDLTRKYIPAIAEAGNVNIMFAGHTHVYSRGVSADPARGARTLYVTQGDARIGDSKIDKGGDNKRPNENFAEILATGKGDMLQCTVKDGLLTCANVGLKSDAEQVIDAVTIASGEPSLQFDNIKITPDTVLSSGAVTVSAKVTNTGKGLAAAAFRIMDNGKERWIYQFGNPGTSRVVALDPGESLELSGTLELVELGKHTLQMAGFTKTVEVGFRKASYQYSNLRVKLGEGAVSDLTSDRLLVKADVKNIGNEAGTASVPFVLNGRTMGTQQVQLAAGETKTVEFTHTFQQGGEYEVTIGDASAQKVSILGAMQGVPVVKDQSGKGNDGLIRGNPTLVKYDGGYGLSLDGVDDYVEIPDRQNYTIDNGMTGMVWANVDRLAKEGEWDHNPLLVKGASISYGTNYLYRMAVRQTGMVTYGVGFDNDNGEYFWNDDDAIPGAGVQLGKWVQYTGGFDRATGGTSWENTKQSGAIDPPDFDSEIKNWPGSSMYAGFSFHRHLLSDRNRGKTHTMLTGDLGQIRFYTAKLTEKENAAIYAAPQSKGPQADKMVVWLDFDPKHIVTDGKHTTEWRASEGALKSLAYEVSLPGAASAKVTVESSADGKTVQNRVSADLKNGTGTIDLSKLGEAGYVRVVTDLHASVTEQATDIPVIRSYTVRAGQEQVWATLAAWNKGTFEGAAGYEPKDFLTDYSADFDDYSGKADATAEVDGEAGPVIGADVPENHWAYQTIRTLIDRGIISGDENGNVRPNDTITREEVAKLLLGTMDIPVTEEGTIAAGDRSSVWAKDILATARKQGIMEGDEHGRMHGRDTASRAQVVTMVARAAKIQSEDFSVLDRFGDAATIPAYAKPGAAGMIEKDMLSGYEDGKLHLERTIRRAEAFTLLAGLLG